MSTVPLPASMTSTMDMSSTMSGMSMATMTSGSTMEMAGMDMSAQDMGMTFFGGTGTPLYSMQFMPTTTGGYAGTCIFLIILAIVYRGLFAFKAMLENRWMTQALNRRYVVVADKMPAAERIRSSGESKTAVLTANGVDENVMVVHRPKSATMPWRFSVDLPRAGLVTVIVGLGYLLMLAVMTLNVGYFLSILAGAFIGELAVGRFNVHMEEHH